MKKIIELISGVLKLDTPLKRVIRRGVVVAIFAALAAFGNEFVKGNALTLDPLVVAVITALLAVLDKARREFLG